jgi:predicted DCC family thiol-disulfide oxidoreductase YuxK
VERGPSIVLFDGVCNLCNGFVTFVLDRDHERRFLVASLQSDEAAKVLSGLADPARAPLAPGSAPDTIVLVEGGRAYDCSTAALRIARGLGGPWRLAGVLLLVPRSLRDAVYRLVARNRYRWFGKAAVCRVPTPELRDRFLSSHPELIPSGQRPRSG